VLVVTRNHRAITAESGKGLSVTIERSSSSEPETLPCACILLATGSSRDGHAMAASLGHTITPPVPSLFTLELGKGATNPLLGLAGISVGMVEVKLLGPAGGEGGAKAFKEVRRNQRSTC
jgi:predicted flavoprotein YhiN